MIGSAAAWHDAECGSYAADLEFWDRLARRCDGPVVDLGSGTGRTALWLAARGHRVLAVDSDAELLAALSDRARGRGLEVETLAADARELRLPEPVELIIAPMQLLTLMEGRAGRARLLGAVAASLLPGGLFAAALLEPDQIEDSDGSPEPLPDVREVDGWVHASLAVEVLVDPERIEIVRRRELVSPAGELSEEANRIRLDRLLPEELIAEAAEFGLGAAVREPIPMSADHVGSVLITLERVL